MSQLAFAYLVKINDKRPKPTLIKQNMINTRNLRWYSNLHHVHKHLYLLLPIPKKKNKFQKKYYGGILCIYGNVELANSDRLKYDK